VRGSPAIKNLMVLPSDVQLSLGTLQDLRAASKGGPDPDPDREWHFLYACACQHESCRELIA
jgi:hypothetical protein